MTGPPAMRGQDNRRGVTWMITGMFLFSLVDAQSKYLSQDLPVLQISWARHFGTFAVVAAVLLLVGAWRCCAPGSTAGL